MKKIKSIFKILGPGLVTGSSDDDPSGITTYSQAGAKFGLQTLWTALITFPLMAAIQEMCARIGLVTTTGLTTTLKNHYPKWILYVMVIFTLPAIILNIGADIAGMGAVSHMMLPAVKAVYFDIFFTFILTVLIIWLPYEKMVGILKYLCLSILLYIAVPFFTKPDWASVLRHTFIPTLSFKKDFFEMLVAILGTTISPYLFFWQVTMEAEDVKKTKQLVLARRKLVKDTGEDLFEKKPNFISHLIRKMQLDVNVGMLLSNLVMFFIILATGTALYSAGGKDINSVEDAAKALQPVAGNASSFLFTLGVIGTGFLAIPVLTGSLSYIVSETFGWDASLDKKYWEAKKFYVVILVSMAAALGINYVGISPIKALYYTAILYGLTSPVLIAIILHIGNSKKIMKKYTNGRLSNVLGVLALILMLVSAIALFVFI